MVLDRRFRDGNCSICLGEQYPAFESRIRIVFHHYIDVNASIGAEPIGEMYTTPLGNAVMTLPTLYDRWLTIRRFKVKPNCASVTHGNILPIGHLHAFGRARVKRME